MRCVYSNVLSEPKSSIDTTLHTTVPSGLDLNDLAEVSGHQT